MRPDMSEILVARAVLRGNAEITLLVPSPLLGRLLGPAGGIPATGSANARRRGSCVLRAPLAFQHKPGPVKLGTLLRRCAPGRGSTADITVCDLTGTGVQDTAIATLALAAARALGFGSTIEV